MEAKARAKVKVRARAEAETETKDKRQAASDCPLERESGRGSPGSDVNRLVQQGEVCPYSEGVVQ